jgi:putative membrane protein
MKTFNKNSRMTFVLIALVAATIIGILAFSDLESKDQAPLDFSFKKTDAQFMIRAAEINLQEIQLGHLAQQKSMSMDAKQLAEKMVKEHTQLLSDLTAMAKKKGVTLPKSTSSEGMEEYKELNNKSDRRFSEEYCELVIKEHKEAINLFEKAAKDASDSEIREWAAATIPALKTHLANAKNCKERCEKM